MHQLIAIGNSEFDGSVVRTANARDIHSYLGVAKDFTAWMKAQIKRARLVDGKDYLLTQKGEQHPSGMKYRSEYHLTIEAAKHVAMMSGTDKGFEVRDYFIECERIAKTAAQPVPQVADPRTAALIESLVRQDQIEQEQRRQASELAAVQESIAVIEARAQPENRHFTVMGYASLIGQKIDWRTASAIGRKCANLSRTQGLPIGDVTDPRFGRVHSYHESVLEAVMVDA